MDNKKKKVKVLGLKKRSSEVDVDYLQKQVFQMNQLPLKIAKTPESKSLIYFLYSIYILYLKLKALNDEEKQNLFGLMQRKRVKKE